MKIFSLDPKKRQVLLTWLIKQGNQNLQKLTNTFLNRNIFAKLFAEKTPTGEQTNETPKDTFEMKKPVVKVVEVDQVALANANQLCEIFSVAEQKKQKVYDWVVSQKNNNIEELVNSFLEILGTF